MQKKISYDEIRFAELKYVKPQEKVAG